MSLFPSEPSNPANIGFPQYSSPMRSPQPTPRSNQQAPATGNQIDLVGPIMRRKLLITLFVIFGAVCGFVAYRNAAPEFESFARIQVSAKMPPVMEGAFTQVPDVSIAKQQRLLTSQLVLSDAAQKGNFDELQTFKDSNSVVGDLISEILLVDYAKKEDDDTLIVSAKGEQPDELSSILAAVISSYVSMVENDTEETGVEGMRVLSEMRDRLIKEKTIAEEKSIQLLDELGIPSLELHGPTVNPYLAELDALRKKNADAMTEHREIVGRLKVLEDSLAADPNAIEFLAVEAKDALAVQMDTPSSVAEDMINKQNRGNLISQQSSQVFSLQQAVNNLKSRKSGFARTMGKNHPKMKDLDNQIKAAEDMLAIAESRFNNVSDNTFSEDATEEEIAAELNERNRIWVDTYHRKLLADRTRLELKLAQLSSDLLTVEENAERVSEKIRDLGLEKSRILEKQTAIEKITTQLTESNVVSTNFSNTRIRVIDPPSVATQIGPSFTKFMGVGVLGGGLLGAALAILIDLADQTYRNPNEIYLKLGVPVLAKLPPIRMPKKSVNGVSPALIALHSPSSIAAEAIRAARTAMFFTAQTEGAKVFMMTSPSPGDGKTTTTANLAISIAQAGKSVVLVDADFRRPRVHAYYGENIEPGVLQALAGTADLTECMRSFGAQDGLTLLTAGGRPNNAGEVVTSPEFVQLIQVLRERFDIVLIDSPPLLPVSDAAVISSCVDYVYMVMRIRKGVVVTSSKAKEKLEMVNARLGGIIVNGVDDNPHYNEYGSYGYNYGYNGGVGKGTYYENRNSRYQEKIGNAP